MEDDQPIVVPLASGEPGCDVYRKAGDTRSYYHPALMRPAYSPAPDVTPPDPDEHRRFWATRWHIVLTDDGLKPMPHAEAVSLTCRMLERADLEGVDWPVFHIVPATEAEARTLIEDITYYEAYRAGRPAPSPIRSFSILPAPPVPSEIIAQCFGQQLGDAWVSGFAGDSDVPRPTGRPAANLQEGGRSYWERNAYQGRRAALRTRWPACWHVVLTEEGLTPLVHAEAVSAVGRRSYATESQGLIYPVFRLSLASEREAEVLAADIGCYLAWRAEHPD
jgi:hypothetical protein